MLQVLKFFDKLLKLLLILVSSVLDFVILRSVATFHLAHLLYSLALETDEVTMSWRLF